MLKLWTGEIQALRPASITSFIARICTNELLPTAARHREILLLRSDIQQVPPGFRAYFVLHSEVEKLPESLPPNDVFVLPDNQYFLDAGDIVRFDATKLRMRTLFRRKSKHNSFLVTERCNNYCLMCSQPPKQIDDSYIVNEILESIPLMDRDTPEIGITGGEPTLLGDDLITILRSLKNHLPHAALHILSNGRTFADKAFTAKVAAVAHPDMMIGIPIYSDISNLHDYVVQADGAFDETIRGILNLKRYKQRVEVRVVIHQQTYERLPQLAEFLARNLVFVDHVALMGLEMMGFTKANLDTLWIDPLEYQPQLVQAVDTLRRYNMNVSVYNHQLCVLDKRLWDFAVKSISDWKNEYMPECAPCSLKDQCGGFFSSAHLKYSQHIKPFTPTSTGA